MSTAWMNTRVAINTEQGWRFTSFVAVGPQQRKILFALGRAMVGKHLPRGTPTRISEHLGLARCTVWTQIRILKFKFGVTSNIELARIAKQLSIRGRGSSNQASMFAPVSAACVCRRATAPQTEALHPGTAPSRVL